MPLKRVEVPDEPRCSLSPASMLRKSHIVVSFFFFIFPAHIHILPNVTVVHAAPVFSPHVLVSATAREGRPPTQQRS